MKTHLKKTTNSRKHFSIHAADPNSNSAAFPQSYIRSSLKILLYLQDSHIDHKQHFLRARHRSNAAADRDMEDLSAYKDHEQREELMPSLTSVYQLYNDDKLQQFVDAAETLLDESMQLARFDTIQLLIYLANSVEDSEDTHEYYDLVGPNTAWRNFYHQEYAGDIRAVEKLGTMLDQIRAVVGAERAEEAERASGGGESR